MDSTLTTALVAVAGTTLAFALILIAIKLFHHEIQRWRGVRSAHYVAAVGEMVSRGMVPSNPPRGWVEDPYFHDALSDYRRLLTGEDRNFIDRLVDRLGIRPVLAARTQRQFSLSRRLRALSTLVNLADDRDRHHLRSLIHDRNCHVRLQAVEGLARLGDVDSAGPILDLLARARPWEAARLADSLVAMGSPAAPTIAEWVETRVGGPDASSDAIGLAARVLGLIGDPSAEPTLIALLRSDQPDWRVAAASALEHTGNDAAVPPLLQALDDDSWQVRARVVTALGGLAHPDVARQVAPLLADEVWWVRQNTAAALSALPGGTDRLISALDGPDPYAADAALNQLILSGRLAEARHRVVTGDGTDQDRWLLDKSDGLTIAATA